MKTEFCGSLFSRIPAWLARDFKKECAHFKQDINEVVTDALRFWLEERQVSIGIGGDNIEGWHWKSE